VGVRLFVGNLDYSVNEADLRAHFGEVGPPAQVALPVDRDTGRPRGFAFVEFAEREVAEAVIRRFNGQPLKGRPLAISEARAREDRPPMSGPRPSRPPFGGGSGGPPPPRAPRGDFPTDAPRGGGPAGPSRERRPPTKGKAKQQERGGPKGPIRERPSGRVMDIEDMGGTGDADVEIDFDDPATSRAADQADADQPDADTPDADTADADTQDAAGPRDDQDES